MISGIIAKIGLPALAAIVLGFAGYALGVHQVSSRALEIKTECPAPVCNCPDPVNTIDFDKVKNFKGTLKIDQNYKVEINGDSLLLKKLNEEIDKKLKELRLARCK
jgi:hypothetical protein